MKGKNIDEASEIKNTEIATHLALPPVKIHCSVLAEDAIKAAIADFKGKNKNDYYYRQRTFSNEKTGYYEKFKTSRFKKVGINTKGCSGLSYTLEYVDKIDNGDEVFQFEDIKIFVDPKSSLFLIGTQVDYVEGELESGFKFINPNEKGRCGCGESFHI